MTSIGTWLFIQVCLRLGLAGIFAIAGVAKIGDLDAAARSLARFGVPARLSASGAIVLALIELIVCVAFLTPILVWWAALAASVMLVAFTSVTAINLVHHRTPECHCFGRIFSAPISWWTVARNTALLVATVTLVSRGYGDRGLPIYQWFQAVATSHIAMFGVGALSGGLALVGIWCTLRFVRANALALTQALKQIDTLAESVRSRADEPGTLGIPINAPSPVFSLRSLGDSRMVTLADLCARGKHVMLVFSDPQCGPCAWLMPQIALWQRVYSTRLTTVVISRGALEANRSHATEFGLTEVLMQQDREVALSYLAGGTPTAVMVHSNGTIASYLALGSESIMKLFSRFVG